ncbi:putative phosducin protein [Thermochaetoides thermophila DSM 1495]|uniref:Putative phosducin protein n=1 Tax=Chaetomium thermophilum (strain DSM 1495 / CBS 144.50 / IMI 039719) TaxID=759272 RepID=G0S6L2_CHATD|nr:putative phosducin protein [Thermochaetoides thermophila DSM 1495]EGS20823.1 putative phosducin protein [Thermochaetoides thermophila DSM 1495]
MALNLTPAQEEFQLFLEKNNRSELDKYHPEDREDIIREREEESQDEEDEYRQKQIEAAMRMPTLDHRNEIRLPPPSFDHGRTTGVKGVIADARAYEAARHSRWKEKVRAARRSVFSLDRGSSRRDRVTSSDEDEDSDPGHTLTADDLDEDEFMRQWRETRRRELEQESRNPIRNRRTSPSVRMYGRFDHVDALGYLDAIEKCDVSAMIEAALSPLVRAYPAVHFVKVHYLDLEFEPAGVPAILAYRNQGDLFVNLTGILELIPDEDEFDTDALKKLFIEKGIL